MNGFRAVYPIFFLLSLLHPIWIQAQHISDFYSVEPTGQTPALVLPHTHRFQMLVQEGDSLGNNRFLYPAPDFTAYLGKNGSSTEGYLSLNHEIGELFGGVTVFDMAFDSLRQFWNIYNGQPIDLTPLNGSNRPCSGGITPWGTVIFGEEGVLTTDADSNKYNDAGWLVEIDPANRRAVQKIWKAGNAIHENCTVKTDERTLYWGADDADNGFVFKYIALEKQVMAKGQLFVLLRDDSSANTGHWLAVPNNSAFQCNNVTAFCRDRGAWNFSGVEDVEIGPDGKVYFSTKYSGRIWHFLDQGATVTDLEPFVENTLYPVQTIAGIRWAYWGTGADNLAFDNRGNLWVLQDGGNNHIWVIGPDHTSDHPNVSLFATTPFRSEPTGITFSPDFRFIFLSFQHPDQNNKQFATDASGRLVLFNRGSTVVIARREFLGYGSSCFEPQDPTGKHHKHFEIKAFPNPTVAGEVRLYSPEFVQNEAVAIRVYDVAGRLCQSEKSVAETGVVSFDFKEKVKGLYRLQVVCTDRTGVMNLVVN